jgi:hypothetical protein
MVPHRRQSGNLTNPTLTHYLQNTQKVDEMRSRGDTEAADVWLRIIVAIGTLGTPPTDARH